MKTSDASAEMTEMARELFKDEYWAAPDQCAVRDFDKTDAGCPLTWRHASIERDVAKGEADLNDDGRPERFFVAELGIATCGSAGCDFRILERYGTEWRVILDDSAAVPMRAARGGVDVYIRILDRTDHGYHRICSGFLYVWNGTKYGEVFKTKKDAEEGNGVTCYRRRSLSRHGK